MQHEADNAGCKIWHSNSCSSRQPIAWTYRAIEHYSQLVIVRGDDARLEDFSCSLQGSIKPGDIVEVLLCKTQECLKLTKAAEQPCMICTLLESLLDLSPQT